MSDELHVWTDAELKSAEDSVLRVAFERGRRAERERIRQRIEAAALARYNTEHFGFALLPDGHAEAIVKRDIAWVLEALGGGDE